MIPTPSRLVIAPALIALLAACGGETAEAPAADAPPEIEARQDNFEGIGDSFKIIRANFEEGATTDLAAVEAAARDINERANAIGDYFPEGTSVEDGYDTEALPSIWAEPVEFTAAQQKLLEESAALMSAAASGDVAATGEQVGALGLSCKNCHDSFRVDDD
jgi:cytochrome c556